jgi:tetratricopeptide (TPR) repeat protein
MTRASWLCLALAGVTAFVYAPVRHHEFVNIDDPQYVADNPNVAGGLSWPAVKWAFTATHAGNWHPVTWLSHMLDVELFGLNAGRHHVTNALLHAANALLLFGLLQRTTGAQLRSACVAALFAVHPAHVESVAWIAERKDVLSTFLGLLALHCYHGYVRRPGGASYTAVLLLFASSLMAKPMLVTLPFLMLLLDFWPLARFAQVSRARLVVEKLPLLALSVASSLVTLSVQAQAGAVKALDALPLARRLANAVVAYVAYVEQALWPSRLAVLYPYPRSLPGWQVAACAAILAATWFGALRMARRHPYLAFGWHWYLGTLVPVIGLVQAGIQARADRYTYLPLVGLFVAAAWGIPELPGRWRHRSVALGSAAALAVSSCAIAARAHVRHWTDSIALWEHALEATRENARAHANLAHALSKVGRHADAVPHYEAALRLQPDAADVHNNFGLSLANLGKTAEAISHHREAVRLDPVYAEALNNLGTALLEQAEPEEAVRHLAQAAALRPDLAALRHNLAAGLNALGVQRAQQANTAEAIARYREALSLEADLLEARVNLGRALGEEGRTDEAILELRAALRLQPGQPDVHYDLFVLLYRQGRTAEALLALEAALTLDPAHEPARRARQALAGRGGGR